MPGPTFLEPRDLFSRSERKDFARLQRLKNIVYNLASFI